MTTETIAIDVALLPDAGMQQRAREMNARLRENYPQGFPLDDQHLPHITLVQAFIRRQHLDDVWRGVKDVEIRGALRAEAFDFFARGDTGSSGFDVNLPNWLREAHRQAVEAVAPFALARGDKQAFVTTRDEPDIAGSSLNYVRTFMSAQTGSRFNPHVTLGKAHVDFLESLRREGFDAFEFGIDALAICQLGNHGTCRKILRLATK
jgi:2'-5' RNA ligase